MGDERRPCRGGDRADRLHGGPGRRTRTPQDGDARDGAAVASDTDTHIAVEGSRLLDLPQVTDERGSLTHLEETDHVPFEISRVYYIYDVPRGRMRGGHAHREIEQLLVAVAGEFDVLVDDGRTRTTVTLDAPDAGLYLGGMTWRELTNFSDSAVCLAVASQRHDEDDYVHGYEEFRRLVDDREE